MTRDLKDRLRARRKALDLSLEKLAAKVGVRYQTIQDLETGKSQGTKHIVALSRALEVSPDWLLTGQGSMEDAERTWSGPPRAEARNDNLVEVQGAEFARLPVYDIRFAAGSGSINEDETPIDHHLISMSLLRALTDAPLDKIGMFQAAGDSMEPTIQNRDWVAVDLRFNRLVNPGIYALVFEGEGLLKRVSRHLETSAVTLISDNKRYDPQTIKKPERLQVVGRVILSIRRH
jgi:phage repressor protein C with HTH and peptisase S24 domain